MTDEIPRETAIDMMRLAMGWERQPDGPRGHEIWRTGGQGWAGTTYMAVRQSTGSWALFTIEGMRKVITVSAADMSDAMNVAAGLELNKED